MHVSNFVDIFALSTMDIIYGVEKEKRLTKLSLRANPSPAVSWQRVANSRHSRFYLLKTLV